MSRFRMVDLPMLRELARYFRRKLAEVEAEITKYDNSGTKRP